MSYIIDSLTPPVHTKKICVVSPVSYIMDLVIKIPVIRGHANARLQITGITYIYITYSPKAFYITYSPEAFLC